MEVDYGHIFNRGMIHFFSAQGILSSVFFGMRLTKKKWPKMRPYYPARIMPQLILCAVVICLFAFGREAYDVWKGGPLIKSYTDYASWLLGMVWAIYLSKKLVELEFDPVTVQQELK